VRRGRRSLFGEDIIGDLMNGNTVRYEAYTMDIFHGQRLAISIAFPSMNKAAIG
jgi:hypothetical protein